VGHQKSGKSEYEVEITNPSIKPRMLGTAFLVL
jgi:hypothetical protein